jgi:hypothetical protein
MQVFLLDCARIARYCTQSKVLEVLYCSSEMETWRDIQGQVCVCPGKAHSSRMTRCRHQGLVRRRKNLQRASTHVWRMSHAGLHGAKHHTGSDSMQDPKAASTLCDGHRSFAQKVSASLTGSSPSSDLLASVTTLLIAHTSGERGLEKAKQLLNRSPKSQSRRMINSCRDDTAAVATASSPWVCVT